MKFNLIDAILEQSSDHIVTLKHVSRAEEYLADHFPTFPVLPGVMMLEAMTQSARMLAAPDDGHLPPVLGEVRAFRYGSFVQPGATLVTRIDRDVDKDGGQLRFKGKSFAVPYGVTEWATAPVAASGRLTLRAPRISREAAVTGEG